MSRDLVNPRGKREGDLGSEVLLMVAVLDKGNVFTQTYFGRQFMLGLPSTSGL